MTRSLLELTQTAEFKQGLSDTFKKIAVSRAKLGLPKAVIVGGAVYKEFPNGVREPVRAPAPTSQVAAPSKKRYSRSV